MKRCIVTGCLGFTGVHLLDVLNKKKGLSLFGLDIRQKPERGFPCTYYRINLSNSKAVFRILRDIKPHLIFHLAGSMFCRSYEQYHRDNIRGTINLLDAVLKLYRDTDDGPIIINAGSSAEYGLVDHKNIPISENAPLRPVNYYGISKMVQGLVALRYHSAFGLKVIHTRTFNLVGPGQSSNFVCGSITRQIAALINEKTMRRYLSVGNMKSVRDFVDVRDAVRAYWLLAQKGKPGAVYNVCSGKGTSISEVTRLTLHSVKYPVRIVSSKELCKKDEIPVQIGDNAKIRSIGWKPAINVERSLRDMVQWLRK